MEIVKKLTEKELKEVREVQDKTHSAVIELGQIELAKLQLKSRRESVEAFLLEVVAEEKEIAKHLEEAYGKGSINLQTGEITLIPAEETPAQ